jgi:hypothetical protein
MYTIFISLQPVLSLLSLLCYHSALVRKNDGKSSLSFPKEARNDTDFDVPRWDVFSAETKNCLKHLPEGTASPTVAFCDWTVVEQHISTHATVITLTSVYFGPCRLLAINLTMRERWALLSYQQGPHVLMLQIHHMQSSHSRCQLHLN